MATGQRVETPGSGDSSNRMDKKFLQVVQEVIQRNEEEKKKKEEEEKKRSDDREKKNNEKNKKEADQRTICQGMIHGRCNFGWNGKGCSHYHPKYCKVFYSSNGFICHDDNCSAHHPNVCHTYDRWWNKYW